MANTESDTKKTMHEIRRDRYLELVRSVVFNTRDTISKIAFIRKCDVASADQICIIEADAYSKIEVLEQEYVARIKSAEFVSAYALMIELREELVRIVDSV